MTAFLGTQPGVSGKPKAYLNWILFDEQFKFVQSSSGAEAVDASGVFKTFNKSNMPVHKNGYLYIYTSNETNYDVFFDNLQVTHVRGRLLEESHYYPFGLTMAGISSKALQFGDPENKLKYNGIEYEKDLGLEVYDAQLRELDGQIGRWWQVDPKTEKMEMWSPYVSNYNNPITYSDPLGDEGQACCQWLKDAVVWINNNVNPLTPLAELATGKSLNSSFTEDKPRLVSGTQLATFAVPTAKAEAIIANEVKNLVAVQVEKQVVQNVERKAIASTEKKAIKEILPDNATVVRGGINTPKQIEAGTGVHPEGVTGISVECGTCSVKELAKPLPNNQIGVTTVGEIRKAGGDVIKTAGRSPNHATLTGLPPQKASDLLNPPIPNPNKK